jgi:peptidoglycan-associated lipoprotein
MIPSFRSAAAALMVFALAASACGPKKPDVKPTPQPPPAEKTTATPAPPPPPPPPSTPPEASKPLTDEEIWAKMTLDEANKAGLLKSVYFEYDSINLSEEARTLLQRNADFLKKRGAVKIMVEGHADSRGTNEYNLALGERRADAVRDYVISLGIPTERVTIVSKGEEQPFCKEESEGCWKQNRVGFFVVTAK